VLRGIQHQLPPPAAVAVGQMAAARTLQSPFAVAPDIAPPVFQSWLRTVQHAR